MRAIIIKIIKLVFLSIIISVSTTGCFFLNSPASVHTSWHTQPQKPALSAPQQAPMQVRPQTQRESLFAASPRKTESTLAKQHIVRQKLLEEAYQVIGTAYKYGGASPKKGFDCSGFIQYIHKQVGVDIPRTAMAQRNKSHALGRGGIRPGDLIFFQTSTRSSHVGLYVGNGQFIHASTSRKKIVIDKLESDYWRERFVKSGTYLQG